MLARGAAVPGIVTLPGIAAVPAADAAGAVCVACVAGVVGAVFVAGALRTDDGVAWGVAAAGTTPGMDGSAATGRAAGE